MDSKFVISVNRVHDLIFVLAVFDLVFVLDLSSKSTSAQNESCRSFNPLQLLFWPNFMFPYEIWSFNWSNSGKKNHLNEETVFHCVRHCDARRHTGDCA